MDARFLPFFFDGSESDSERKEREERVVASEVREEREETEPERSRLVVVVVGLSAAAVAFLVWERRESMVRGAGRNIAIGLSVSSISMRGTMGMGGEEAERRSGERSKGRERKPKHRPNV